MLSPISFAIDIFSRLPESGIKKQLRDALYQDIVSERILEYPLVFKNLQVSKGKVLDVGCRYSNLVLQLASLGYDVHGIDLEPYPYSHPNLTFTSQDIRKTRFKSNFFDIVTAISTVEHIGLGYYEKGVPQESTGDAKAIAEIIRILKKSGQLIFTAPFGKKALTNSYRVYDQLSLDKLFGKFSKVRYEYFTKKSGCWTPEPLSIAKNVDSSEVVNGVVLAVCIK